MDSTELVTIDLSKYLNLIELEKNFDLEVERKVKENNDKEIVMLKSILDDYKLHHRKLEAKSEGYETAYFKVNKICTELLAKDREYDDLKEKYRILKNKNWFSRLFQ